MRRRFFVERFDNATAILRGEAAHHLGRVLRAEPGHLYELSDGETLWLARTERVGKDAVEFSLVEPLPAPRSSLSITLFLAIVKFDAFEWALEKATELGADEIVPLAAERSEKGLIAALVKRAARWEKILFESAQQSRRLRVPVLRPAGKPRELFDGSNASVRLMLSERPGADPMRDVLQEDIAPGSKAQLPSVALAIGPEGGWTDLEFVAANRAGFKEVALGTNILRTETAVCAALAVVQFAMAGAGPVEERSSQATNRKAP
jgi:16S rRNA (uracil1498-N3)-methyltransferase